MNGWMREGQPLAMVVAIVLGSLVVSAAGDDAFHVGGALELQASYLDFDNANQDRYGDLDFGSFRLKADGTINDVLLSLEYRMYSFMHTLRYGWMGYDFTDELQFQLGVTKVPFGLLPYASHTFWESMAYPLGFEDDSDMGVKGIWQHGPWNVQFAFFKSDEYGNPSKLGRYSIDTVQSADAFPGHANEEQNQGNLRVAHTITHGETASTELGLSVQGGGLYNSLTESYGDHRAAAVHVKGTYGAYDIMLEAVQYAFNPANPETVVVDADTGETAPVDDRVVIMGAFEDAYAVASKGSILIANLGYTTPVDFGPVTALTFYNDFSVLVKDECSFNDSSLNTIGCLVNAHPVWIYVDAIIGKNSIYLGGPRDSFAAGGDDEDWHTRFNLNITYYF